MLGHFFAGDGRRLGNVARDGREAGEGRDPDRDDDRQRPRRAAARQRGAGSVKHARALFLLAQRTEIVRDALGQHGHDAVDVAQAHVARRDWIAAQDVGGHVRIHFGRFVLTAEAQCRFVELARCHAVLALASWKLPRSSQWKPCCAPG